MRLIVRTTPDADAEIAALSPQAKRLVNACFRVLRRTPFASGTIELRNNENLFRREVDGYRVVFLHAPNSRVIEVRRVRPRVTAYEGLNPPSYPQR